MSAPPAAGYRLAAEGLVKRYRRRTVVDGVSLHVQPGEVVGLLGPNGAGKTTCFYMIVGLERADAGRILLDGRDVTREPLHRRARAGIGYLPQEASVFRRLTVLENVLAVLELQPGLDEDARRERAEALLHELQIGHLRDSPGLSLSGGERRRVEIARALAAEPRYMLLDEPFAGVDPLSVIDIQRLIGHLTDRGLGVLVTDHNVRETLRICTRAYILTDGRILAEGEPAALVEDPRVRQAYLGEHFRL